MKQRIFFFLKNYLGFTNKESLGFLVLVPILLLMSFIPNLLSEFKNREGERRFERYQFLLDSLDRAGFVTVSAPLPPADTSRTSPSNTSKNTLKIDFSESDSVTLQIIPGIGPAMASRIIKFRENLGGLHSARQLMDVYGMKEETFEKIWEYFEFSTKPVRQIPINEVELEQLSAHPYFTYGEAKVIIAFRKQHGKFQSKEDLLKIKIFKPEWVDKIAPYLDFR